MSEWSIQAAVHQRLNAMMNRICQAPPYYPSIILLATAMALGSIYLVAIGAPFDHGSPVDMISGWIAFIALSPILLAAGNRTSHLGWKQRLPLVGLTALVVAVLAETAGTLASRSLSEFPARLEELALHTMDDGMRIKFICAFAVVQIVQGLRLRMERIEQDRRAAVLEAQLSATRLSTLRMQLHPHFLFNTLNSVTVLLRKDRPAAREMLRQLSELFQRSFDLEGDDQVPFRDELTLLQNYIDIEKTRFGDRLRIVLDVDDDVMEALIPSLILQPLVENSIRHGLAPRAAGGFILVRGFREEFSLVILVSDDGRGLPPEGFREGIGLKNTRMRLEYLYGSLQEMAIGSGPTGGVTVKLRLPLAIRLPAESAA